MAKMIFLALALLAFSASPALGQACADFPEACGSFVGANPCKETSEEEEEEEEESR